MSWSPRVWLQQALTLVEQLGPWGPLAFILLYALETLVPFLPASVLSLGAGVLFGVVTGALYVLVGAMLGAIAAFGVARYLARERMAARFCQSRRFQAIDRAVAREGTRLVFLLRLTPAFPFNVMNYALGLTRISLGQYILGTIGILPGTLMYVYLGSLASNLALLGSSEVATPTWLWVIRGLGLGITVGLVIYLSRLAQRALAEELPPEEGPSC